MASPRIIGISSIFLIIMLQACIFRSLILNYTDTFLISEIESTFEPTSDKQDEIIKSEVEAFWKKFRCVYMQDMKNDFNTLTSILAIGINEQSVETMKSVTKKWRKILFTAGIELLAKLKPSLKPKQISSLKLKFAERTDKIKETLNLDAEDYLEARKEKILENFETFYGQANGQQQTRLFLIYGLNRSRDEIRLENRKYFNDFFVKTLLESKGEDGLRKSFADWIETPALAMPEEKREAYTRLMDKWYQRLIETDKLITKKQRQHLIQYITELKTDLLNQALPASECKA